MDVWPGIDFSYAGATTNPTWEKPPNGKRISFEVEIPDHLIGKGVDFKVQETSIAKEVKND